MTRPATGRGVGGAAASGSARTPAQQRLLTDLLAWGVARPVAPAGLAARLRARIDAGVAAIPGVAEVAAARPRGSLTLTRGALRRLACDGWYLDPVPHGHTRASVRGTLVREAVAADVAAAGSRVSTGHLVDRVWRELASRRPGDPASASAWLNARPAADARDLRDEVADLVEAFREVWPPLADAVLVRRVRRLLEVRLADGLVILRGTPDLVLDSPRADDRARALAVEFTTAQPRPEEHRADLRLTALLVTLATGMPPFRWATFYVTEGRSDVEDLAEAPLEAAARRVVEGVAQAVRASRAAPGPATTPAPGQALRLEAGAWCADCRRRDACPVAAAARP